MKKPRLSISRRFGLTITAIVLLIIAGIAIANHILLSRIYAREKRRNLAEAYQTINKIFTSENFEENLELEKIYSTKNITVFIADPYGNTVFSSTATEGGGGMHEEVFRVHEREQRPAEAAPPKPEANGQTDGQTDGGENHWRGPGRREWPTVLNPVFEALERNEYRLDTVDDNRLASSFIQLSARLNNNYLLYLRTPMGSIDDAASIANRLLLYIGAAAVIISLIIIALVSGAMAKPIRELTGIARDISELNFSRRYNGSRSDEIGELGASINLLSQRLEEAITGLKAANAGLERDLRVKEAVDRERKEFIANASHELKTPLALISGYAEGLKTIALNDEDRDFYCDVIADEASKMDKIIRQLLTVTELESSERKKESLDLGELVRGTVKNTKLLAEQKGASITLSCPASVTVVGDELALYQAVINYITNAIHYVDERGIISVSLSETNSAVRFSVFNSGKPIPEESREKIWESFYKLDKARTRAYGGSGLGLSIVKKSIEQEGGRVGFTNRGDGVEFFFELPK